MISKKKRLGTILLSTLIILSISFSLTKFSTINVEAVGNIYYVDFSNGNNSNSGLSEILPWKTLSKVSSITFNEGDTIKLKCGEVWNESVQLWGQGSESEPITLTYYGTGNKPKIRSNAYSVVSGTNIGGWKIQGIAVECTTTEIMTGSNRNTGISFYYDKDGEWSNITIEDNEVFGQALDRNTDGIKVGCAYPYVRQSTVLSNIIIKNNLVHEIGWTAISTVGWDTSLSINMRTMELYKNVKIFNNTVYNTGGQGIMLNSVKNGAIKWNLVHDCGKYTGTDDTWGAGAIWCMLSSRVDIMFNEAYNQSDSNNGNDACGFDIDWTCEYINVSYNYAHDNKGPGIETMANRNCTIMYNTVKGNNGLTFIGVGQIALSSFSADITNLTGLHNIQVANNVIFVDKSNTVALSTNQVTSGSWTTNSFKSNSIIYGNGLSGTKVYDLTANALLNSADYNRIYSASGTLFTGTNNGTTYSSISSWRSATGFDTNSILSISETVPPTALINLTASQNSTFFGIDLAWNNSTDSGSGISHYNIHRSTSSSFTPSYTNMVGEATNKWFTDIEELNSNTTYYYKITAEDNCGNVGAVGSVNIATGTESITTNPTYQASKDYSTITQRDIWSYMYWNGSNYNYINSYDDTVNAWRYSTTNLLIYPDAQLPDAYDSVRKWTAPYTGYITITAAGNISNIQSGGDGVNTKLVKNNTKIWPASNWQLVTYSNPISFPSTSISINEGDSLYFIINKNLTGSCDVTKWDPIITYTSISTTTNYQSSSGFSNYTQGQRWYYKAWNGTAYSYINTYEPSWYAWRLGSSFCSIGSYFQHPDYGYDSVRGFICPRTGTITISCNGNIYLRDYGNGQDGVYVKLMLNDIQLWPEQGWQKVDYGTPVAFTSLQRYVNANDQLYFVVNANANPISDTVIWEPIINYN